MELMEPTYSITSNYQWNVFCPVVRIQYSSINLKYWWQPFLLVTSSSITWLHPMLSFQGHPAYEYMFIWALISKE